MGLKEIFLFLCIIRLNLSVDPTNFKTCEQSSFCRRCRNIQHGNSPYYMVPGTLNTSLESVAAEIVNKENDQMFIFKLEAVEGNIFRVQIDEKTPLKKRYVVVDSLKGNPKTSRIKINDQGGTDLEIIYGENKAVIHASPFSIDFYQNDVLSVSLNAKGLMKFEHLRSRPQTPQPEPGEINEDAKQDDSATVAPPPSPPPVQKSIEEDSDAWGENFKSHHDSKPYGPEAVAMDFSFPQAEVLFGIPEHADSFILKPTSGTGTDPYRLYNLDVFEYELDSKMALYGSVPVLYGHGSERTAGVFWNNAAETWVDIYNPNLESNVVSSIVSLVAGPRKTDPPSAHFMSESGIIDAFILLGPTPLETFKQYTDLTGTANLPQLFALAYHQSRWNYNDEKDVETVSKNFDEYDIPMDVMWLDIEYTQGKKYFTWDSDRFPNPLDMIKNLTSLGRHLTIIIDPHIKREDGYFFHDDCTEKGFYTKTREGKDYEGWCWPGSASYPDLFNSKVRKYFADQYLLENFKTVTEDVMIWNDMNEPSVFNGPEVTMLKDNVHFEGWEHRDVHNLYGHMQLLATFDGLLRRSDSKQRPFILSRSHFAGSQRYAAIWTGDNKADWGHLQASIKICLSEAVAGFSFCGSDVGGFFGNPDGELFYRWYQAAAFQPFFRSHSHIDTKRREPWVYRDYVKLIRDAIRKRYSYLPFWYTMFFEHEKYGFPVMRPLLAHYPKDKNTFSIDSEYLLQDRLLVSPVLKKEATEVEVYFPIRNDKNGDLWYDIDTYERIEKTGKVSIPVDDQKIPVFQRGGTIIPKKERVRRAATLMINDPYTLIICLDANENAKGTLFIDDEKSYKYREGYYAYIEYEFKKDVLENRFIEFKKKIKTNSWLEKIVIAGLNKVPKYAKLFEEGKETQKLEVYTEKGAVVVRKPGINMLKKFEIKLIY